MDQSNSSLNTLSDQDLVDLASGFKAPPPTGEPSNDELMRIVNKSLVDDVDTTSGAPASVRAAVGAAQKPTDKLKTLREFYPDAQPVEVLDPKYGATKFGRGNFIYTNPQTGKRELFDEDIRMFGIPVPTARDFADVGPEVAETIGAIGGGIIGAGLGASAGTVALPVAGTVAGGTAGFVVGEGVGSAAARETYIKMLDWFGDTEDSRTGAEQLGDFATTAGVNMAAGPIVSKIWNGVKFVAGQPIRYASNALSTPAKEAYERIVRSGVSNPSVGAVTSSPMLELMESALINSLPSTKIMRENAQLSLREMNEQLAKIATKYGGVRTTSEASERAMSSMQAARQRYTDKVNKMYTEVGELIPDDLVSDAANTRAFVDEFMELSKTATGKDTYAPAMEQAMKVIADAKDGKLTYNALKDFRTSLGQTIDSSAALGAMTGPERRVKTLYAYISRDLDDLVDLAEEASGNVKISKLYGDANNFVKKNMQQGGDIRFIDKAIAKGGDEATAALKYALGGTKDGAERLVKLRNQLTPEEFEVLSGYMLGKMGMPRAGAAGLPDIAGEISETAAKEMQQMGFSPSTFMTNWNTLSGEARQALFGGTRYKDLAPALDDLAFTIERVGKSAASMANPSGTARVLAAIGTFGGGGALVPDGFGFGLMAMAGPYLQAKLMTNKDFVKWLAEGVEKAAFNPNSFGQHVRRLFQISEVNPEIRQEVQAVIQGLTQDQIEPSPIELSSPLGSAMPVEDNEQKFRQSVPSSVADKLLPNRDELIAQMDAIKVPMISEGEDFNPTGLPPSAPMQMPEQQMAQAPAPQQQPPQQQPPQPPQPPKLPTFAPLPTMGGGGFNQQMSSALLENPIDREIANRMNAEDTGIASLV